MALPNVFATTPAGNVPASQLDTNFTFLEVQGVQSAATTGSANTYLLTPADAWVTTYANYIGRPLVIIPNVSNTSGSTLNVSGLGAITIKKNVGGGLVALTSGDLIIAIPYQVAFDGTQFVLLTPNITTSAGFAQSQAFTGTGTFTPAAGVTSVYVEVWGGGGGGAGAANVANCWGGGGGGGGYSAGFVTVTPTIGCTVTVGAGGTAGTGGVGNIGGTGGTSSFAGTSVTVTATGGVGGTTPSAGAASGAAAGGAGSNGVLNISGGAGGAAIFALSQVGRGGIGPRGGAGADINSAGLNGNGVTGVAPGGGGSGALGNSGGAFTGGVGGAGRVLVYYP